MILRRYLVSLSILLGVGAAAAPPLPPGIVEITGVAVSADGIPADFAEITADCNRVVCTAGADGAFRCRTTLPQGRSFCIEHPRLGRKRVLLEGRSGAVELGTVKLVTGSTIRVVRPLHVAVPEEATVSLLLEGKEVAEPQAIGSTELVEFEGLKAGTYSVLLAGKEPLQRKLFSVKVPGFGESEVILSLDAYRLTGEVVSRKKPLAGATVTVDGDAWQAEFPTGDSGRFDAELWGPGAYGVSVSAPTLEQPYLVMMRASPSDSHWRLEVPWRRISGRIFDAESGTPIREARLLVESDSGETRAQRFIDAEEDGTFRYPGAGEGRYAVTASADGYMPGERLELQVRESDEDVELDLPLLRGVDVQLTAVDPQQRPIADATVLVTDSGSNGALIDVRRTAADGTAVVSVPSRAARLAYVIPPASSFTAVLVSAENADKGIRLTVPDGAATLRLRVRLDDGTPLPGVSIILRHAGHDLPPAVLRAMAEKRRFALQSDANGELTIPGLPAGEYQIAWRQPGARPSGWTNVTLGAGETTVTQTFAVEAAWK